MKRNKSIAALIIYGLKPYGQSTAKAVPKSKYELKRNDTVSIHETYRSKPAHELL